MHPIASKNRIDRNIVPRRFAICSQQGFEDQMIITFLKRVRTHSLLSGVTDIRKALSLKRVIRYRE